MPSPSPPRARDVPALVTELRGRFADEQSACGDETCEECAVYREAANALTAQAEQIAALQARADYAEKYLRDISVTLSDAGCLALTVQGGVSELLADRDTQVRAARDLGFMDGRNFWQDTNGGWHMALNNPDPKAVVAYDAYLATLAPAVGGRQK